MKVLSESRVQHELHHFFSVLPLVKLDHRSPQLMAGLRFVVSVIITVLGAVLLVNGLWWGAILAIPIAGLVWTGLVDLTIARDLRRPNSPLTSH
jgi:hypothetical protein